MGVVRIDLTPVPQGLPVVVGDQTVETDVNGEFTALVDRDTSITISSGLPAVAITPMIGLGEELAANPPLDVPGYRLLEPGPAAPCKVFLEAQEYVVWPYTNSTLENLEVPLTLNYLNNMASPGGAAVPDTLFIPGPSSFMEPLNNFSSGGIEAGEWNILGRTVPLPNPLLVCTDSGDGGQCSPMPAATLEAPFRAATDIVTDVIADIVRLERLGRYRSTGTRNEFTAKGSVALSDIRRVMRKVQPAGATAYVCEANVVAPADCRELDFPRNALRRAMTGFFNIDPTKIPKGLRGIVAPARIKRALKRFEKSFEKAPRKYWRCD